MSRKDLFQQLRIASPCSVEWDSMIGNDRVRFCEHCRLSVHHIDSLNRKQIRRLIARSHGRVCVNYTRPHQTQTTLPILHKIGRRTSALAAGAFSATLGLSAATASTQPNFRRPSFANAVVSAAVLNNQFSTDGTGKLRGHVFDPNGAVITGAVVTLTNSDTNEEHYTVTSGDGEYQFNPLQPGTYTLKIESQGFATQQITNISIKADDDSRMDQTLSIAPVMEEVTITGAETTRVISGGIAIVMPSDPLVKAAMEDDLEALNGALVATRDANVRDKDAHTTALEYAVRNGNREMVQVLLWAKVDVNARDEDGQTVLMMLSEKVTSEIVWDLINAGAKVNHRDKDGDTALLSAAEINNVDALKALLDAGAKVNTANNDGETALMKTASNGFVNNVRALILAGADVNARDKEGKTALMYANSNNEPAVARLLKAHGAIEFVVEEKQ
jgi:Carboxypeptidase regulatory-like domain/Ankyrin repeats (3 copies)/Ankyrin repeat